MKATKLSKKSVKESEDTHALPAALPATELPTTAPSAEKIAAGSRGRILMVSWVTPCPPSAGNEQHIYRMLRWLRDSGYEVIYLLRPNDRPWNSSFDELRKLVFRLYVLTNEPAPRESLAGKRAHFLYQSSKLVSRMEAKGMMPPKLALRARLAHLEETFAPPELVDGTAVLARRYRPIAVIAQYIFMTGCFAKLDPSVMRIVDTHDMFSTRREKVVSHGIDDMYAITAEEERTLLNRADVIMTSQRDEAEAMRALGLLQKIFTIAIDMDLPAQLKREVEIPGRLLIVASDNDANAKGVQAFLARAWPHIKERHPQASLRIVGKVCRHLDSPPPGVILSGFVHDLAEPYGEAQIVINPVYAGSGLKIKSVEALSYGKPLISWPVGADGMGPVEELPFVTAALWPAFVDRVSELLADPELRSSLSSRALEYIRAHYTTEVIYQPLKEILERGTAE